MKVLFRVGRFCWMWYLYIPEWPSHTLPSWNVQLEPNKGGIYANVEIPCHIPSRSEFMPHKMIICFQPKDLNTLFLTMQCTRKITMLEFFINDKVRLYEYDGYFKRFKIVRFLISSIPLDGKQPCIWTQDGIVSSTPGHQRCWNFISTQSKSHYPQQPTWRPGTNTH